MMAAALPSLHRVVALGLLVALLLAGWFVITWPLIDVVRDRQTEIGALSERLAHLQAVIARKPELERREQALEGLFSSEGGFWNGVSTAAIAATVQDRLRRVVVAGGGVVKSTSEIRATADRDTAVVKVRFRIEGTLETVQRTLSAIGTIRPALFVDNMTITGSEGPIAPDQPPVLDLDLEVSGFMRATRS